MNLVEENIDKNIRLHECPAPSNMVKMYSELNRKKCVMCKEDKTLDQFNADSRQHDGKAQRCRVCRNAYRMRSDVRENVSRYNKEHRKAHALEHREKDRRNNLKQKFGITIDQYQELFAAQKGKCAVCGKLQKHNKPYKKNGTIAWLCVDHNHETNKIRGLLCDRCNRAIGLFGDSTDLLFKALVYLKQDLEVADKEPQR